ncbi:MAG TPA: pitrilysin family protein [Candidatus Hydrogenedentes bacterium]|nr:pitrilysin family protein [Candidatus Hydrogenedentota bacterium]HOH42622.1 pitrilysin family protein [Candidatus Hydrogenedentota bacterium]HOM49082.1 pitrilysin family protein [Candidatus Hydrogenedentota bacterium]HOR49611.1 pitrilysin family protein [Candidatus Hydrogenedentota bacterium]HPK23584.1 pitrilysin family protein [Candidatus Hydrogenedentota bacterium]
MTKNNFDENIRVVTLPNGFRIAMEHLPYLHSASLGVWIKAGSASETQKQSGLAHFLEHLFFKGTKNRNVHEIMDAIESKGGYFNAGTSQEYTTFYVRMLAEHVEIGAEVLGDLLLNSLFCDLEKERNVVLEEIASIEDTPDELASDLLAEFHWPDHPLGRPVSGYAETVAALSRQDLLQFYDAWYKPENMVFAIAGNFDQDRVLAKVEEIFSGLPAGTPESDLRVPRFQAGTKLVERPISQVHVGIATPAPSMGDQERYAGSMLSGILGGSSTSRLFEKIREEEGLAYNVCAYISSYVPAGMMGIYEAVAPQNCAQALDLTFKELDLIRSSPVSQEELNRCREQLKGSLLMAMESTHSRISRVAKNLLFRNEIIPMEELVAGIEAVTAEGLLDFANRYIRQDACALLLLGPKGTHIPDGIPL